MNKKGQILISFVLLLPLLIAFLGYVIDVSYIKYEENKLDNIVITNKDYLKKNTLDKNKKILLANDTNITDITQVKSNLIIKKEIPSYFGKIVGFKKYNIKKEYKL
ncbi:MAG: hypothetical protein PHQ64_01835 [Bacilli bacterium]|nr:hypothetical protein [Bacilli bacterium]